MNSIKEDVSWASLQALSPLDYQQAVVAVKPGACNLSGLANDLALVVPKIWNTLRMLQALGDAGADCQPSTENVNNHPIVRLYVEQMFELCGLDMETRSRSSNYYKALEICERKAKENE
jgi:hypothetical protein